MSKMIVRILTLIFAIIILSNNTMVKAANNEEIYVAEGIKIAAGPSSSIDSINVGAYEDKIGNLKDADSIKDIGNILIGVVQFVGSAVSVLALIVIGIKYMMGSLEEKAQYKQTMKPYVIGAFLIFGVSNLIAIIASIAESM